MPRNYATNDFLRNYLTKILMCISFAIVLKFVGVDGKLRIMQEGAVVKFADKEYISDVKVFTVRRRRNDPYLTNITATIHTTFGNNVTLKFSYLLPSGNTIDFSVRTCDAVEKPWMYEFAKTYSNLTVCPVAAGTYRYYNVEIPPKNFPLPLPPGLKKGDSGNVNVKLLRNGKDTILDLFTTYGNVGSAGNSGLTDYEYYLSARGRSLIALFCVYKCLLFL